ncbi:histidine kinase dimerization/phosphoacceptor domain -containing protein [Pararhodonellum marinum]|uniref:histidine kinase dimerization/phosphoacceptor domain -containing protein n=1 Tax=Pararhodonellum marinum TaxID=2755358 RepID=UPI0018901C6B|nr:histidine kinase dimerization/phosphoacceptor domain -containing protein [Pararhodonellum marinum]
MKIKFQITLFMFLFIQSVAFPQSAQWLQDSLGYYQKQYETHLKDKDLDNAKKVLAKLEKQGIDSLDPLFFDFFNSAIRDPKVTDIPGIRADLYKSLGLLEYYRGDIIAAKAAFTFAKEYYEQAGEIKEASGLAMNIGVMQEKLGQYDSAINNYLQTIPVFESLNDAKSLANVYENLGLVHSIQSKHNTALEYLEKTDSLLNTYLDSMAVRWIGLYMNKNMVLSNLNRQDEGLTMLLKGFRIAEHNEHEFYVNRLSSMMADVYNYKGETDKQYAALLKSKSFFEKRENKFEKAGLDLKLGNYHFNHGSLDSAMMYARNGYAYYAENGLQERMGLALNLMGNIEFTKKDYKKAVEFYNQSLAHVKNENTQDYSGFLFNIGYALNKEGRYDEALKYLENALTIRIQLNDISAIKESYQGLSETYQNKGDYRNAYDYLVLFNTYSDSLFNETKNRQLSELETQYETEKKDQAISVLEGEREIQNLRSEKQQAQIYLSIGGLMLFLVVAALFFRLAKIRKKHNDTLEAKNKQIAKQNDERELLLKEIHHRVKNNLQIISSLLSMQTRGLQDAKVKDAMKESQSRVKTMALIHEKLYQYENLSKINMQEYMHQLSDFLTQTYRSDKQIIVNIEAEEISLDMDMAIPIGLITNELLSNSLKYAFENMEFGEINITFSQYKPGSYKLLVEDTGKGLDESLDIDKTKSLGLKLVRTLTRQINGQLTISSNPGASFEIDFEEVGLAA